MFNELLPITRGTGSVVGQCVTTCRACGGRSVFGLYISIWHMWADFKLLLTEHPEFV